MALQYAISGIARCANTRSDYYRPIGQVTIGGTLRSTMVDKPTVRITQSSDGQDNTAFFECFDFTPTRGQEVIISSGTTANRIFAGIILNITALAPTRYQRVRYQVSCVDYHWLLTTRRVTGRRWTDTSVTQIINDLMTDFAPPGFTTLNVERSMDPVDFTANHAETLLQALQRVMKMASKNDRQGGYLYVDYSKDLHAYVTPESDGNPLVVNASSFNIWDVEYRVDLSQVRTRTYVLGATSQATSVVETSATVVPVDDVSLFSDTGGQVLSFGNVLTYTATSPTSGPGLLTGVSGFTYPIPQGESVRILATRVNSNAASSLAAILGSGDGLIDHVIEDERLNDAGARDRGDGDLGLFAEPETALSFTTRAKFVRAGKVVTTSLSAPAVISGEFLVQRLVIDDIAFGAGGAEFPRRSIEAGKTARNAFTTILATADRVTTQGHR